MIDAIKDTRPPAELGLSAKKLRESKAVAGRRDEVKVPQIAIELQEPPTLESIPEGQLDGIVVLGYGEVQPTLGLTKTELGTTREGKIGPTRARMRHGILAGLEVVARKKLLKKGGTIFFSGTATANPTAIEDAQKSSRHLKAEAEMLKDSPGYDYGRAIRAAEMQPANQEEVDIIDQTTEGQEMSAFFLRAHAKVEGNPSGADLIKKGDVEIFPEHLATETLDNFIYTLNELDRRSVKAGEGIFKGKLGIIASRYHIARAVETAHFLGITDMVPIVSQTVLEDLGYGKQWNKDGSARMDEQGKQIVIPVYDQATKTYDETTRDNEMKWIRALYQVPEYGVPVLAKIENNERFIATLKHVKALLGERGADFFNRPGLKDLDVENAERIRLELSGIPRLNPEAEKWMETDHNITSVNKAVDGYVNFTHTLVNSDRLQ